MAQEEKHLSSTLKSIVTSLQQIAECPVCLDTVTVPFKTCSRGHAVCTSCCEKLKECPTCEGEFTAENLVCFKNILEALPRHCVYSGDGCEEVLEPGSDHEECCGYRRVRCREIDCKAKVPLVKLMNHYEKDHPIPKRYICSDYESFGWNNVDPKVFRIHHFPVVIFDNVFFIHCVNDIGEKNLKVSFQAIPIGKLKSDFFARVMSENEEYGQTSTLKAFMSRSHEIGEYENYKKEEETDWNTEHCMRIPQSLLHRFIKETGKLEFVVKFFEDSFPEHLNNHNSEVIQYSTKL